MTDGLVGDGELAEVVTNHVGLDLNLSVVLTIVDTDHASDHLGDDDHVAKVSLDGLGLAILGGLLLGLSQAADKLHGDAATGEAAASTSVEELHELRVAQVQQSVDL